MQLDPIIVVRGSCRHLIVLRTFDDVRGYVGADHAGPKIGVIKSLARANSEQTQRLAVREFTRWARMTELLVTTVSAEDVAEISTMAER